ncbi:uncharacterized protein EDB91DRAFT_1099756 [Suillus paluster]|uniref:uncharacterized protein n=1 Tax=Suillus paluster TaxID=48578 RepID=UPI001B877B34|nr:uncharacterized protein EDB91DRAFT_1099756 [Suillus paluster]KAG1753771.1 hypothetical protein EDB91DRAFT_1099756 [Suillus paluster]
MELSFGTTSLCFRLLISRALCQPLTPRQPFVQVPVHLRQRHARNGRMLTTKNSSPRYSVRAIVPAHSPGSRYQSANKTQKKHHVSPRTWAEKLNIIFDALKFVYRTL